MRRLALLVALAACGKFQDPNVVLDLRVIAMTAALPEQVVDVDLTTTPPATSALLAQLVPSEVCALVAEPNVTGSLHYTLTLCELTDDDRCTTAGLPTVIGTGTLADPDVTQPEPRLCATVMPDGNLIGVLLDTLNHDPLHGLQGEPYEVELRVGEVDADPSLDIFAAKTLQVMPDLPAGRTPNRNPTLTEIDVTLAGAAPVALPLGRCVDQTAPIVVAPGTTVRFTPVEPAGVRETYTLELIDGTFETFTENLSYQWTAGAGSYSAGTSGGPRDLFGNEPALFTDWTAPAAKDLDGPTDVPIWIVQRDERFGAAWYESCLRVVP